MPSMPFSLRTRLTLWYVAVLAVLLLLYAALVFGFQYVALTHQMFHDEVQDVVTAEGLLYFDAHGALQLQQNYYSRPQSHLLVDRLMEVVSLSGHILYRSPTLHGTPLAGPLLHREGDSQFNERVVRLSDGTHALVVSHMHTLNGVVMVIRLGYSLAPLRERMVQFLLLLLIAVPVALVAAGTAGQTIARRGLRPLEEMTSRAEGITASNLHDRLQIENPRDELGQMAIVFNRLLERLEQAFLQMKRFTADAAHELRTPLAAIRTTSEVALGQDGTSQYKDALVDVLEETTRLNETIDGLLLLARAEASQPGQEHTLVPLQGLVDEVLGVLSVLMEDKQIAVVHEDRPPVPCTVLADRALLRIAFMNVVHNAAKFSPRSSVLRLSWSCRNQSVRIAIHDQGPGILVAEQEAVFERFHTSRAPETAAGSGAGLGLSIARLIINRAGGNIRFETVPSGASCIIELPLHHSL
jgi:signal transduction histidine kinase